MNTKHGTEALTEPNIVLLGGQGHGGLRVWQTPPARAWGIRTGAWRSDQALSLRLSPSLLLSELPHHRLLSEAGFLPVQRPWDIPTTQQRKGKEFLLSRRHRRRNVTSGSGHGTLIRPPSHRYQLESMLKYNKQLPKGTEK